MNRNRNRGYKGTHSRGEKKVTTEANCGNSLVVNCFRGYAEELSNKHDRYERIVKQSRDITIESKRLIFLLHSVDLRKSDSDETLIEAFNRLMALCTTNFHNIAKEMFGHDHYQYARAYSAGLQEFIEALSFHNYLRNDNIYNWNDLQQKLTYKLDDQDSKNAENVENPENPENQNQNEKMNTTTVRIECLVQPYEFMLGLADLSGEIMRKCINSLGNGDVDACQSACSFIQELHSGYLSTGAFRNKEMSRKIYTMYQSVLKAEKVCYNVKVRGKEAARWIPNDALDKQDDEDAGFVSY